MKFVSMTPGAPVFTWTPNGASSSDMLSLHPSSAHFVAVYTELKGYAVRRCRFPAFAELAERELLSCTPCESEWKLRGLLHLLHGDLGLHALDALDAREMVDLEPSIVVEIRLDRYPPS
jgi:hypothetical protein